MKYSTKLKLISFLSALVVTTSLVATACTTINKTNSDSSESVINSIDINTLPWVTRSSLSSNNIANIKREILADNNILFSRYRDLEEEGL